MSIGHVRGGAYTFGCLVVDRRDPGRVFLLTNSSAVWPRSGRPHAGDPILQPAVDDGGDPSHDVIAGVARWLKLKTSGPENIDAALALVHSLESVSPEILERGHIRGIANVKDLEPDGDVFISGRTSGVVAGKVTAFSMTLRVSYPRHMVYARASESVAGDVDIPFDDAIETTSMLKMGDVGAILLDADNHVLGLGFAASDSTSYFMPIGRILDTLNVDIVDEATWERLKGRRGPV